MTAQSTDDQLWSRFLGWLDATEPTGSVESILEVFRADIGSKTSPEGADRSLAIILNLMRGSDEI